MHYNEQESQLARKKTCQYRIYLIRHENKVSAIFSQWSKKSEFLQKLTSKKILQNM